ncbi:DUF2079 domain-containing protein [Spirulina sp. CCNP1310]|uniref:DUF2079 domain-containing protein n=1 Tax=Spirulina sp. CCNP1310 TaxID=3110249 RepID=UPI002B205B58|nr:DUF2079 domain-containing protein [Spirulina sp. CCNP1310]MEA5421251.1 DUF2079 domain-containing protein [Spirulina sp. CCNP1310]
MRAELLRFPRFDHAFSRGSLAAAGLFFTIMAVLVLHRHHSYLPSYTSFDQGIFNQVFWNSLQGRWFQSSLSAIESISHPMPEVAYRRLGQHFTPALLLWLPIYAIARNSTILLILAVGIITAGGLMLYQLARLRLPPHLALLLMIGFYTSRAVAGPTLGNFQDLCQLPLFMFGLFWALEKRAWGWFALWGGLVLAVREDAAIVVFSVGLYLLVSRRQVWVGAIACLVSFSYAVIVTTYIMPLFSDDVAQRFLVIHFASFVEGDRTSSLELLIRILRNPVRLLQQLLTPFDLTFNYLLTQGLPLALLPFLAPTTWILILCPLSVIFLRDDPWGLAVHMRYALAVVPGLWYGAILWWDAHPHWAKKRWIQRAWQGCIALSIVFTISANPHRALSFFIPDSVTPWVAAPPWTQWPHAAVLNETLKAIPPNASVTASNILIPHLSNRREMLGLPFWQVKNDQDVVIDVDYIVVDLQQLAQYQGAFVDDRDRLAQYIPWLQERMATNYGLIRYQEGVVLLQRDHVSEPELEQQWQKDVIQHWQM